MIVVDTNVMIHLVMGGDEGEDVALLLRQDAEWAAPAILMSELRSARRGGVTARARCPVELLRAAWEFVLAHPKRLPVLHTKL